MTGRAFWEHTIALTHHEAHQQEKRRHADASLLAVFASDMLSGLGCADVDHGDLYRAWTGQVTDEKEKDDPRAAMRKAWEEVKLG